MARPTIDQIRSLGDFATLINWNLSFVTVPSGVGFTSDGFNFRCESTDLPKWTGTSTEITIRGHTVKQPGIYRPSNQITLTMNETVDNYITRGIKQWRELCWATGTGVAQTKQSVEAIVRLTRNDRADNAIYSYLLYGVFLEDYDPGGQLQSSSADVVKPTLTLSYDYSKEE